MKQTVRHQPNPASPELIAYRTKMTGTINAITEWIDDHGPVTDPELNDWVLSQVAPMLTDGIEIAAQECSNGWWVYSFKYPAFVQPSNASPL